MPTKKVTRRWLYNSFLVILIFLSLLIIAFSIAVRSYYYNSVLTIVRNTASVQNASLVNYSEDNTVDFSSSVRKMVEELLDFSRLQSGRLKLSLTKLDLVAELSDAVLMFTERARQEHFPAQAEIPSPTTPSTGKVCWHTLCWLLRWTIPTFPLCAMSFRSPPSNGRSMC